MGSLLCFFFLQSSSYRKKKYWLYSNTLKESENLRTKEFGIEILSQNSAIYKTKLFVFCTLIERALSTSDSAHYVQTLS